jgi:hypothetical protein
MTCDDPFGAEIEKRRAIGPRVAGSRESSAANYTCHVSPLELIGRLGLGSVGARRRGLLGWRSTGGLFIRPFTPCHRTQNAFGLAPQLS